MKNEKNLKKISAILALMAIPTAALAGCTQGSDNPSNVITPPSTVQTTDQNNTADQSMSATVIDQMTTQQTSMEQNTSMGDGSTSGLSMETTSTTPTASSTTSTYKDGTYSATGYYTSPAGQEHIDVSLTLKNDVVTASTVTAGAKMAISVNMQKMFIDNYKQYVDGKNIDDLNLTQVSGSSLTPGGFNDAVAKIKAEAKA